MLRKMNKDVLCKAKWEKVFGENVKWKTIHSGVIDNWELLTQEIIYMLSLQFRVLD